jgi:hypothetical protein
MLSTLAEGCAERSPASLDTKPGGVSIADRCKEPLSPDIRMRQLCVTQAPSNQLARVVFANPLHACPKDVEALAPARQATVAQRKPKAGDDRIVVPKRTRLVRSASQPIPVLVQHGFGKLKQVGVATPDDISDELVFDAAFDRIRHLKLAHEASTE